MELDTSESCFWHIFLGFNIYGLFLHISSHSGFCDGNGRIEWGKGGWKSGWMHFMEFYSVGSNEDGKNE